MTRYDLYAPTAALDPLWQLRATARALQAAVEEEAAQLRALGCNDATIAAYTADAERTPWPTFTWLRYMRRCLEEQRLCAPVDALRTGNPATRAYEFSARILTPPTLGLRVDVLT